MKNKCHEQGPDVTNGIPDELSVWPLMSLAVDEDTALTLLNNRITTAASEIRLQVEQVSLFAEDLFSLLVKGLVMEGAHAEYV